MRATCLKLANQLVSSVAILALVLYVAYLAQPPQSAEPSLGEPYRVMSPSGGAAPHPAVMLVPGCSGFSAHNGINLYEERATELQRAGYAVVFVDYVRRRMQRNCAHISQTEVAADILEATKWVKAHPGIDASRISVIGWSYGGGGILAALQAMPADTPITKAVMYYPVCRGAAPWSAAVTGLILLGALDDITDPALCDAVVKGMAPDRLRAIWYANARHGFDMPGLPERTDHIPGAPAYDARAASASWTAVLDFLN